MRARWLFLLAFLVYLLGPVRPPTGAAHPSTLGPVASAPFESLVRTIYPTADPADRALWSSRLAGAAWTAAAVGMSLRALECLTTPGVALALSLLAAFPSPFWSWASRSDTPHAPAALVVAALLWLAVRPSGASTAEERMGEVACGALAASLFFFDATHPLTPLALLLGVRVRRWTRSSAVFAAAGAGASALAVRGLVASTAAWPATAGHFRAPDPAVFAAYLASPGRGLVFFVPLAALAVIALLRGDEPRRLVRGCAFTVGVALAEVACLDPPWRMEGFGPSTLAPYVPLLAAMAAGLPPIGIRWGAVLALPAAVAHGGAVFVGGHTWDERRDPMGHPEAVWDVRDTPFADLLVGPPRPEIAALVPSAFRMPPGEHVARAGEPLPWLVYGWETPEPTGTWASGPESWIVVAVPPGDYAMTLMAAAPRVRGRPQRLAIERPGGPPLEVTFAEGLWNIQPVIIHFRPQAGVAIFKLRPAHTYKPGHGDVRRLSVFVASIWLDAGR